MRLIIWVIISTLISLTSAKPNIDEREKVISPGTITLDLFFTPANLWRSGIYFGTGVPTFFLLKFDTLVSDIYLGTFPLPSQSFVPVGPGELIVNNDVNLEPQDINGLSAYETIIFNARTLYGQGFLVTNDDLGGSALIAKRIIAFATDGVTSNGFVNIGSLVGNVAGGPFTNFSANLDTGNWTFGLTDVHWGNITLGYNGIVTVASASPISFLPPPVMDVILSLLNATPSFESPLGGGGVQRYYTQSSLDYENLPNLTYYIQNKPFVMTKGQYFSCSSGTCTLYLSESTGIYPYNSAWTLGVFAFNQTYSFFDFDEKVFGVAPLKLV